MFENLCTLPFTSDLFTQALHPTEPILAVGLAAGHVQAFRLPASSNGSDDENASVKSSGTNTIDEEWGTRRHKGSCRSVVFSGDGECMFSSKLCLALANKIKTCIQQVLMVLSRLHRQQLDK